MIVHANTGVVKSTRRQLFIELMGTGDSTSDIVDIGEDAAANVDKGHKASDSCATNTAPVRNNDLICVRT